VSVFVPLADTGSPNSDPSRKASQSLDSVNKVIVIDDLSDLNIVLRPQGSVFFAHTCSERRVMDRGTATTLTLAQQTRTVLYPRKGEPAQLLFIKCSVLQAGTLLGALYCRKCGTVPGWLKLEIKKGTHAVQNTDCRQFMSNETSVTISTLHPVSDGPWCAVSVEAAPLLHGVLEAMSETAHMQIMTRLLRPLQLHIRERDRTGVNPID
jgi:hypothetical protein